MIDTRYTIKNNAKMMKVFEGVIGMIWFLVQLLICAIVWYEVVHIGLTRRSRVFLNFSAFSRVYAHNPTKRELNWRGPVHISKDGSRQRVLLSPAGYFMYMIGGYWC